jgi:hypothetical protein
MRKKKEKSSPTAYYQKYLSDSETIAIMNSIRPGEPIPPQFVEKMRRARFIFPVRPGDETDSVLLKNVRSGRNIPVRESDLTHEAIPRKMQLLIQKQRELQERIRQCPQCDHYFIGKNGMDYCSPLCKNAARYRREGRTLPTVTELCEICQKPMNRKAGSRTCSDNCRQKLYKMNHPKKLIIS